MTTKIRHAACLALLLLAAPAWAQDTDLAKNAWTTDTKADFEAEVARIPEDQRFTFLASAERVAQTVKNILVNKTLAAQARAEKVDQEPAVQAEIAAAAGKVLARHRLERAEAALKVPDFTKRADELYRASPGKYAEKDVVHTMQILVDTRCRTPDAAKARAMEARAEVLSGKPFAEVAKKYSDDPTVSRNAGDVGPLMIDQLAPAFAEAVSKMKPGELSEPVLTNFGYHVIRLESFRKGRQFQFSEVRASLLADLKEDWLKQQRKALIDHITEDPGLKLELDAIQALKTDINVPAPQPSPKRPG
jgi:peptidyl-prolyl cis-trans isomerase C